MRKGARRGSAGFCVSGSFGGYAEREGVWEGCLGFLVG